MVSRSPVPRIANLSRLVIFRDMFSNQGPVPIKVNGFMLSRLYAPSWTTADKGFTSAISWLISGWFHMIELAGCSIIQCSFLNTQRATRKQTLATKAFCAAV